MLYHIKKHYKTFVRLTVGLLIITSFCLIYADYARIKIIRLNNLDNIAISAKLKHYLLTQNEAKLIFIRYDKKSIYFYAHDPANCIIELSLIFENLVNFANSKNHNFFPGDYLLAIDDGVHHKLEYPVLGFATTLDLANKNVILIPDHQVLKGYEKLFTKIDASIKQNPWSTKLDKIFWRGGYSVDYAHSNNDFDYNHRLKFVNTARKLNFVDAAISRGNLYIDPAVKQELIIKNLLRSAILPQDSLGYKYLFDLDGYSCSYVRMAWVLYSNSMLMKHASDRVQWYYDQLEPYKHYVPIAKDFSDLEKKFEWAQTHPVESKAIADNGRELAKKVFDQENVLLALEQGFIKYHAATQGMFKE